MTRPLRIEYPGAWYHVMNRGRRNETIFSGQKDYHRFIDLLIESCELWNIRIGAYCLMPNHYHLLIQTPNANLSRCMRHINAVYTQRYNRAHGCDGQLFRGRFKSILVDGDTYLLQLVRYIHRNPLRSDLTSDMDKYKWSSHVGYISTAAKWNWLYKDFIFSMLSSEQIDQIRSYKRFVRLDDSEEMLQVFESPRRPPFLGGTQFIEWIKVTFFEKKREKEVPDSVHLAPNLSRIKAVVCDNYNIQESILQKARRGVSNEPRDVTIYLARMLRQEGLREIGTEFGLNNYSSVSSTIERVKSLMIKDHKFRSQVEEMRRIIMKSQTKT
ncbi:MAG: transposase [Desulfobacterales bacterium]